MGSALNAQQLPLPPEGVLPPPPSPVVLQPNGRQAAPPPPPERAPVDTVRDPNFNSLMQNQNYFNMLSQLLAERQARGPEAGLMPIGNPEDGRRIDAAIAERNAGLTTAPAQVPAPVQQMGQMQNYNQMLQQGMRRNQDMNQAAQNLVAPAGPARSFSQVVGGVNRMNRMPRQPRNNSLAPSNQKLI